MHHKRSKFTGLVT